MEQQVNNSNPDQWYSPANNEFPKPFSYVLVKVESDSFKQETAKYMTAQYIPAFTEQRDNDEDVENCCDWSEEHQCYFAKAGWYTNTAFLDLEYALHYIYYPIERWRYIPE